MSESEKPSTVEEIRQTLLKYRCGVYALFAGPPSAVLAGLALQRAGVGPERARLGATVAFLTLSFGTVFACAVREGNAARPVFEAALDEEEP